LIPDQLTNLNWIPAANYKGSFQVSVVGKAKLNSQFYDDQTAAQYVQATAEVTFSVNVAAVADRPTLSVSSPSSILVGSAASVSIDASKVDPSEELRVELTNVSPADTQFSVSGIPVTGMTPSIFFGVCHLS
jgi:hypothetical protein